MSIKFLPNYQKNYYTEVFPAGPGSKNTLKDLKDRLNHFVKL